MLTGLFVVAKTLLAIIGVYVVVLGRYDFFAWVAAGLAVTLIIEKRLGVLPPGRSPAPVQTKVKPHVPSALLQPKQVRKWTLEPESLSQATEQRFSEQKLRRHDDYYILVAASSELIVTADAFLAQSEEFAKRHDLGKLTEADKLRIAQLIDTRAVNFEP